MEEKDMESALQQLLYNFGLELKLMRTRERVSQNKLVEMSDGAINRVTLISMEKGHNTGIKTFLLAADLLGYEIKFEKKQN